MSAYGHERKQEAEDKDDQLIKNGEGIINHATTQLEDATKLTMNYTMRRSTDVLDGRSEM